MERGVIYLGNIPHGFFENDMRQFFRQFGNVTRIRLSRSKKVCNTCVSVVGNLGVRSIKDF